MSGRALRVVLTFLMWGAALGLAYGQTPLFTSNQNQYFLHGLAQAGVRQLQADWLASTRDPTPLFTLLVRLMAWGHGLAGPQTEITQLSPSLNAFALLNYLLYLLVFGFYLAGAYGIANRLFSLERSRSRPLLFLGLLFVAHSAALRYALGFVPGGEWNYLFDGGLGGQRLLGPVFQPSVFGVLLLFSIWLYLEDRRLAAMLATVAAASLHPTYLLSATCLSAVYGVGWIRRSTDRRRPVLAAAAALALVLPIVVYVSSNFLPPSEAAQQVLVEFRIPDHAVPAEWFDLASAFQLAWITTALVLVRRTRLPPLLLALLGAGAALTLWQQLSGSDSLALLFPWRTSATLVPLATAVLLGWIAHWLLAGGSEHPRRMAAPLAIGPALAAGGLPPADSPTQQPDAADLLSPHLARGLGLGLMLMSVVSGVGWSAVQFEQRRTMPERGVFEYVRRNLSAGDLYLVPAKMQDFRLATGAPILADFKSIPYYGPEVLEWHQRVRLLDFFYRGSPDEVDCGLLEVFAGEYGVTHVVTEPDQHGLTCDRLELQYDDGAYSAYAVVDRLP